MTAFIGRLLRNVRAGENLSPALTWGGVPPGVMELALDRKLSFARPPNRSALRRALAGAVVARGRLDGLFERP
jgi:hypothetical protein